MLTATYTLVALSVEQTSIRVSLQSLQKLLSSNFHHQTALTPGQVDYACDALTRLHDSCRWRKVEQFLIPAIRRVTGTADQLLQELAALSQRAAEAMAAIGRTRSEAAVDTKARVTSFCEGIARFCGVMLERLDREEYELFPVARAVIPGETWFAIANQMLADDSYQQESRGPRPPIRLNRNDPGGIAEAAKRHGPPLTTLH
jgi:hypothetical protein